ncbi:hypothetical protein JTE90_025209 [Oedothorax gibbosus]|uniref:Uncharacterized protein n=1 Tax=Oedothorax gibbosus TaxID=931172 RepID=A0AAV6UWL1_9ARAC|nr:hypothetical protein JTE90_025209 [Oedothorax gibbosus]
MERDQPNHPTLLFEAASKESASFTTPAPLIRIFISISDLPQVMDALSQPVGKRRRFIWAERRARKNDVMAL